MYFRESVDEYLRYMYLTVVATYSKLIGPLLLGNVGVQIVL